MEWQNLMGRYTVSPHNIQTEIDECMARSGWVVFQALAPPPHSARIARVGNIFFSICFAFFLSGYESSDMQGRCFNYVDRVRGFYNACNYPKQRKEKKEKVAVLLPNHDKETKIRKGKQRSVASAAAEGGADGVHIAAVLF